MNPMQKFLAALFGYDKKIKIWRKVGTAIRPDWDLGKYIKTKLGTRKLRLYNENLTLPYPPSEAVIEGHITLYSPAKDKYAYLIEEMDLALNKIVEKKVVVVDKHGEKHTETVNIITSRIKTLDSDDLHWIENEITEANNKYLSDKKKGFEALFPYIAMAICVIAIGIFLAIYWTGLVQPALETAKGFTTMAVTCNVSGMPQIPANAPTI